VAVRAMALVMDGRGYGRDVIRLMAAVMIGREYG
jgi:hypothetical protein